METHVRERQKQPFFVKSHARVNLLAVVGTRRVCAVVRVGHIFNDQELSNV